MNIVMTIAGSDSGGGAGIQADLKTFQELKVFGTSAITALTAQNTLGVEGIYPATVEFVKQQIHAILADFDVKAIKTGMLFSSEIIHAVGDALKNVSIPLVVDPVMIAKGGAPLLQNEAVTALKEVLLPIATVITPNLPEAEVLTGIEIKTNEDKEKAAKHILNLGMQCVVMKGGHTENQVYAIDDVYFRDGTSFQMQSPRIQTKNTHGTGCTFSAAITAFLGRGFSLKEAIIEAKKFVQLAIEKDLAIGNGHGPTNHFAYQQFGGEAEVTIIE